MSPASILAAVRADGLTLTLDPPDTLRVRGPAEVRSKWLPRLRAAKSELLALLSGPPPLPPETQEAIAEALEERAAIRGFEGREPKWVAEREARSAMRVYDLLIAQNPGEAPKWVTLLAPGCDLVEATRAGRRQFGEHRLLKIAEHPGWDEARHPAFKPLQQPTRPRPAP